MPRRKSGSASTAKTKPVHVTLAALLPTNPADLLSHCTASWDAIKADTVHFPTPPSPATLDAALTGLSKSLQEAETGGPVEMAALAASVRQVHTLWGLLTKYVQLQLRGLPVTEVPPILATILMYWSKVGTRPPKAALAAKDGPTGGTARAIALAILHALTYTFEWSGDGQSWSSLTSAKTRVLLTGLTPGKQYTLRLKAFLRDGTTTDPVSSITFIAK